MSKTATVRPIEEWRDVPGFESQYEVSSLGNVRSVDRLLTSKDGKIKRLKGKMLRPGAGDRGYRSVVIVGSSMHVAHLVAAAFFGVRPKKAHVAHLNGNPSDDGVSNLAYTTAKENNAHKIKHGTLVWGEHLHLTKFSEPLVAHIRQEYATGNFTQRALAEKHGMSQTNISSLTRGNSWKYLSEGNACG
jgi:hypothetical protein